MTLCLIVIVICFLLYGVCRVAVSAPEAGTVKAWAWSILGTFSKPGEFTTMKKILICLAAIIMMLTVTAFADGEQLPADEEAMIDVENIEAVAEPGLPDPEAEPDVGEESPAPDPVDTPGAVDLPEQSDTGISNDALRAAEIQAALNGAAEDPTPEPSPTPDPEQMTFEEETLTTLGNIEALLLFFAVVLLAYFAYKFLRLFF